MKINKYHLMTFTAFVLSIFSATMTALGMSDLFQKGGVIIFLVFVCIDLGRFLLFNFLTDEWKNLRKIKYVITIILALLFGYSAVGIFSQLSNMISPETHQAMLNAASYNKAAANALVKQTRSSDMTVIAKQEYTEALKWNLVDYDNCLKRAKTKEIQEDIDKAENKCNNTKRWLDNKASKIYKQAIAKADESLDKVEVTTKDMSKNQSDLASILTAICEIGRMDCGSYQGLQNALSIIIILVIVGTDYLQIAIVLAVNTRKNKKQQVEEDDDNDDPEDPRSSTKKKAEKPTIIIPKKVIKKKTKVKGTKQKIETQKLSKKLLEESKPNRALKETMKAYEKTTEEVEKPKKVVKAKIKKQAIIKKPKSIVKVAIKTNNNEVKKENTETKEDKKVIENKSIMKVSDAQAKEIEKLKKKLKKSSSLEEAFVVAKQDIKKSSKIKGHRRVPFTSETDFM